MSATANACLRKTRFSSKEAADAALAVMQRLHVGARLKRYRCGVCLGFHLGRKR